MDIQSLKKYIHDEHKIEYVLSSLGCHNIRHNKQHEYYSAAQKDGDNPMGVVIYDNTYLNYVSYSRNVGFDTCKDIVNLIQDTNKCDFVKALKWLHDILDLKFGLYYRKDEKKDLSKEVLGIFEEAMQSKPTVDVSDIREISEEALNDYIPILHIDWFHEGIMPWTRDIFGLCYSYKHKRSIIPLRYWADGKLLGFNQRTMIENWKELGISKYFITPSYKKNLNLYGLWENKTEIEKKRYCVVVESEKSVLKRHSLCDGTLVALQGKTMSEEQRRIINSLDIDEVVIALDNDVPIEHVRFICDKFYNIINVSYIQDKHGILGNKDSPCDKGNKVYEYLFKHRIPYQNEDHKLLIDAMKRSAR